MVKRKVDANLIAQMSAELKAQEAPASAYSKTDDANFPVFSVPLDKQLIVYIPKTPVTVNADGVEVENPCISYQHAVRDGNSYANIRCINGLHNDALGFDGDCPLCNAVSEAYQVYSKKLAIRAKALHVDITKDSSNPLLQPVKTELAGEMPVKRAEKFLTFPIVVLTEDATKPIDPKDFKVYFWDVREQHLKDKFYKALNAGNISLGAAPTAAAVSPFGRFFSFDYRYDTKGAQPNKMQAAKNVQYTMLDGNALGIAQFIPTLENLAAPFTDAKAVEVVRSVQLWYKEDLQKRTDDIMGASRAFLLQADTAVADIPAVADTAQFGAAAQLSAYGGVAATPAIPGAVATAPVAPVAPVAPTVATAPTTAPTTPIIGAV